MFKRAQSAKKGRQLSKLALNSQGQGAKPCWGSAAALGRSGWLRPAACPISPVTCSISRAMLGLSRLRIYQGQGWAPGTWLCLGCDFIELLNASEACRGVWLYPHAWVGAPHCCILAAQSTASFSQEQCWPLDAAVTSPSGQERDSAAVHATRLRQADVG